MVIKVMMTDWKTAHAPDSLKTSGLGSCVAVVIYDPVIKTAAMAHVMLPCSEMDKSATLKTGKYADTAIPDMVEALSREGANPSNFIAKIAGGAQMFGFKSNAFHLSIGTRNVQACLRALAKYRIPVVTQDTGGTSGRTVEFFCEDGHLAVRTVSQGVKLYK